MVVAVSTGSDDDAVSIKIDKGRDATYQRYAFRAVLIHQGADLVENLARRLGLIIFETLVGLYVAWHAGE